MRIFSAMSLILTSACGALPNAGEADPWQVDPPTATGEVLPGAPDDAPDTRPADPADLHTSEPGVRVPRVDAQSGPAAIVPGIYVAEVIDASGVPCDAEIPGGAFEVLVTLEGAERVVDGFALLRRDGTDGLRLAGSRTLPGGSLACAERETMHGAGHFIDPMSFELELTHTVAEAGATCDPTPACAGTVRARFTWDRAPSVP
jgi:hypothetical protein